MNNPLKLHGDLLRDSVFVAHHCENGFNQYASIDNCMFHFIEMCMWMRKNFDHLPVYQIFRLFGLYSLDKLRKDFPNGYHPADVNDMVTLALHIERVQVGKPAEDCFDREDWLQAIDSYNLTFK